MYSRNWLEKRSAGIQQRFIEICIAQKPSLDRSDHREVGRYGKFYQEQVVSLLAYAEHEFKLNVTGKDGVTLRETLKTVERIRKYAPEGLINPNPEPYLLEYLWNIFLKLHNSRQSGIGPLPISHQEILSFCALHKVNLSAFELNAISALDRVALTTKE